VRRPEGDVKDLRAVGRRARRSVDAAAANRLARFLSNFPSRRPSGALYGPRGDGRLHARVLVLKYRSHRAAWPTSVTFLRRFLTDVCLFCGIEIRAEGRSELCDSLIVLDGAVTAPSKD
jgi:hypothetical protein